MSWCRQPTIAVLDNPANPNSELPSSELRRRPALSGYSSHVLHASTDREFRFGLRNA